LSSPEQCEVPLRWDARVDELQRSLVDALGSAAELVEEPAPAPQERAWLLQPASRDDAATLDGRTPLHQSATNGLRANHALWPSAGGQETVTNNGGRLVASLLTVVVAATGCVEWLGEDLSGGFGVANRTDRTLHIEVFTDPDEPGRTLWERPLAPGDVRSAMFPGCGLTLEARDDDGKLVSQHPPVRSDTDAGCEFTWVITDEGSHVEP
jgi:hypothetical protein